jgi:hypothetical protein
MNNKIIIEQHKNHKLKISENNITCLTCAKNLIEFTNKIDSIEINQIFTFDNLPENSRKLAIEKFRNSYDCDYNDWNLITESGIDTIKDIEINDVDLTWQLDNCQSDFVAITGNINLTEVITLIAKQLNNRELKNIKKLSKVEAIRFEIKKTYRNITYIKYENIEDKNIEDKNIEYNNINRLLHKVGICFSNYIDNRLYELKKYMQEEIDLIYSDEYIIEIINTNQYKFDLYGNLEGGKKND